MRLTSLVFTFGCMLLGGYLWGTAGVYAGILPVLVAIVLAMYALRQTADKPSASPPSSAPPEQRADLISLDTLESAALLIDRKYGIVAMNAEAVAAFGSQQTGEDIRVAIRHPSVIECVTTAMRQNRDAVREIEGLGRHSVVYRLRVGAAGTDRLLLSFADVSPARLAERMRADFVANASHELRTPLATLVGFIETLQGTAATDEAARDRFLDVMASEADRMTRLIDDLLSLSRIELDKNVRPREAIALEPLVNKFAETVSVSLEETDRVLVVAMDPDLPNVTADKDQILQVMHNLVSNAVKYGRAGSPITLSVKGEDSQRGRMQRVTIEDIGEGIPAEHLPRLTERFYRVDAGRSRSLGGTGLGLAIVKHIVERHRGMLDISSEIGKGTKISFTLPVALSQN